MIKRDSDNAERCFSSSSFPYPSKQSTHFSPDFALPARPARTGVSFTASHRALTVIAPTQLGGRSNLSEKKTEPMREIIHPCSLQPRSSARSGAPTLGGARFSCAHSLDVTLRHALFLSDCAAVHVNTQCCSAAGEWESELHD